MYLVWCCTIYVWSEWIRYKLLYLDTGTFAEVSSSSASPSSGQASTGWSPPHTSHPEKSTNEPLNEPTSKQLISDQRSYTGAHLVNINWFKKSVRPKRKFSYRQKRKIVPYSLVLHVTYPENPCLQVNAWSHSLDTINKNFLFHGAYVVATGWAISLS